MLTKWSTRRLQPELLLFGSVTSTQVKPHSWLHHGKEFQDDVELEFIKRHFDIDFKHRYPGNSETYPSTGMVSQERATACLGNGHTYNPSAS